MLRPIFANLLLGFCLFAGSSALTACGSNASASEEAAPAGTLSLPLLATAGQHTYRLQGYMYVSGADFRYVDLNGDQASTPLMVGSYYASLQSWQLTRDDGSGNFLPVNARLMSTSMPSFSIFNGATSTISFQFETDGLTVTVGAGTLNVKLDVVETAPPCVPLGTDCAAGTWCAPPELTGASASCILEGPLAEGDPCNSPLDCPANTSCFDFGAGATCVMLCDRQSFGLLCGAGGLCTAQGADYGVCAPSP